MSQPLPDALRGPFPRIASIDAVRGLTILLMIFVNDIAGVQGVPWWMEHFNQRDETTVNWYASGMTFVDWVFPSFLFIVGMAIPLAIGRRLDRGEPHWQVWRHILIRTLGLLVAGVFMVNGEMLESPRLITRAQWELLLFVAIILVWNWPPSQRRWVWIISHFFRGVGIAILIFLAAVYQRTAASGDVIWMRTSWWGILGLIGWAYLMTCLFYVPLRRHPEGMVGAVALLYLLFFADKTGMFDWLFLRRWLDFGTQIGSHAAITSTGAVVGMMLMPGSPLQTHEARVKWGFTCACLLAAAGVLLTPLYGVNKNAATPSWCLLSSALTVWLWCILYYVMDIRGWKGWSIVIRPAGENPLMAYVLHPLLIWATVVFGWEWYANLGAGFATGFWRAVAVAFLACWLAGGLKWIGIRLRL